MNSIQRNRHVLPNVPNTQSILLARVENGEAERSTRQNELPQYTAAGAGQHTKHQDLRAPGEATPGGPYGDGTFELHLKRTTRRR